MTTDRANVEFWNELCGSILARSLGITDHSAGSIERFDRAYLEFYPYLLRRANLGRFAHRRVLEIGLGYGTLGQKIVEAGADYFGIDIADAPVRMMRQRLRLQDLPGACARGSALSLPVASASVDYVISIGCLHHTGNVEQALDEIYRVLAPGGSAILMVYNQFSYRQWMRWPIATMRALLRDRGLLAGELRVIDRQRRPYDSNTRGQAAPETVFLSILQLRRMLGRFSWVEFQKENSENLFWLPRKMLLSSVGRLMGLDLYIEARK